MCIDTSVQHNRIIIASEVNKVLEYSQAIDDSHILDNIAANLKQFSSALKQHLPSSTNTGGYNLPNFVEVDKFAPAQKNERQLQFKRTTNKPGRQKTVIPLK